MLTKVRRLCKPHDNHKAKTYSRYTKIKHIVRENHQITKEECKRGRKEKRDYKTARK